jgi:glycosyltransferase involved in cell wall biosynthesis
MRENFRLVLAWVSGSATLVAPMHSVLLVSKPVAPPWNDSGKNLVRDLAGALTRYTPTVLTRPGADPGLPHVRLETPYAHDSSGFSPALVDNARVALRLLAGPRADLWHFFFAPNPRSSQVGRLAARVRRVPSVHTVASAPRRDVDLRRVLFADVSVVLSRHTEARFLAEGVAPERLARIAPAIAPLAPHGEEQRRATRIAHGWPADAPVILYPGDLEVGEGAERVVDAVAALPRRDVWLVLACRAKTPAARDAELRVRERVRAAGLETRTRWAGETRAIHAIVAAADVVALPSTDLYAKMDHPLVLLEAMSLARPVVVARGTPAEELADDEAAIAVEPGAEALSEVFARLLDDASLRAAVGRAAERAVAARHAPGPMAASYEAVYDALLAR